MAPNTNPPSGDKAAEGGLTAGHLNSDDGQASGSAFAEIIPGDTERALSIGQTGSGKTALNMFILEHSEHSPWIVYNTKPSRILRHLPNSQTVYTMDEAAHALNHPANDYVIIETPPEITADAGALDQMLLWHEKHWEGVGAYVDELYHFHKSGRAGPGLTGLYTRGREKHIPFLGSTQRPAWVSGFVMSESQRFYVFHLKKAADIKRVEEFIPGYVKSAQPGFGTFRFNYHKDGTDRITLLGPVPIDNLTDGRYKENSDGTDKAESEPEPSLDEQRPTTRLGLNWL